MRVCVIGAGVAGAEAAREAARNGADVTLVDSLGGPLPDWRSWPELICGEKAAEPRTPARRLPPEVTCAFGSTIVSVARGSAVAEGGGMFRADRLVVATGSIHERISFEGRGKPGVTLLDSPEAFARFGRDLCAAERVLVAGEGARVLQVAERAASGGRGVTAVITSWQHAAPGPLAAKVLCDAASRRGVSVRQGRVDRALGPRALQAVLVDGEVVPADALAVAPRRVPRRVPHPASPGRLGGVRVGFGMETTVPDVFAAGGCAELSEGNPPQATLEDELGPSGRIAGANAAGGRARMPLNRRFSTHLFGLLWTRVGTGVSVAGAAGLDVIGERADDHSSCAMVYDRAKGDVLGMELVGDESHRELLPHFTGRLGTLRSLAYDGALGSSDISMVSETARLGLEAWSRS
ncbi:MAG: FAD-dependent oxidoreductase [Thaumarchaeota archaeon]|nr:FAD-dependent oxidoreductase [Nitrososphaerota archaeon]